ncbi:hypothetical protein PIB30_098497 [Stylosanthes scabra]|uniref:Uncharacterized protein n=1 Tax=Stylosanthes scabra TaxID=79078 RepID=A0ABU6UZ76_9FABA|nr:hypothetical protein [Stylosanthes scabra]
MHSPRSIVSWHVVLDNDLYVQASTAEPHEYCQHRSKSSMTGNHLMWTKLLCLSESKYSPINIISEKLSFRTSGSAGACPRAAPQLTPRRVLVECMEVSHGPTNRITMSA